MVLLKNIMDSGQWGSFKENKNIDKNQWETVGIFGTHNLERSLE